jgi:hypothetical protein
MASASTFELRQADGTPADSPTASRSRSDGSGGGLSVNEAVTLPFLPELKVPVALTGPDTVVLFEALGLAPPSFTQTTVRVRLLGATQPAATRPARPVRTPAGSSTRSSWESFDSKSNPRRRLRP